MKKSVLIYVRNIGTGGGGVKTAAFSNAVQIANFGYPIIVYSENDLTNQTLPCNAIKLQLKSFISFKVYK